jgi:hypothetical protein
MASELNYRRLLFKVATLFPGDERTHVILTALAASMPGDVGPYVQLAYSHILRGEFDQSLSILRDRVLAVNPQHTLGQVYKALALRCKGILSDSNLILEEVKTQGDPLGLKLAEALCAIPPV